jgi:UDP-N-acetylglucosamine acyltransferase
VDDWAVLGGYTGVHQFCRVGVHTMTAVGTVVLQDIPPYVMAAGNTATPYGINVEGLKRRGFSAEALLALKRAYRTLYKSGLMLEEARAKLAEEAGAHPEIQPILDFLAVSRRGIIR